MAFVFVVAFSGVLALWWYLQVIEQQVDAQVHRLERDLAEVRKTLAKHLHAHDSREPKSGWLP
jgi:hypothetical protein